MKKLQETRIWSVKSLEYLFFNKISILKKNKKTLTERFSSRIRLLFWDHPFSLLFRYKIEGGKKIQENRIQKQFCLHLFIFFKYNN